MNENEHIISLLQNVDTNTKNTDYYLSRILDALERINEVLDKEFPAYKEKEEKEIKEINDKIQGKGKYKE